MLSLFRGTHSRSGHGGIAALAAVASLALFAVALPTSALADELAPTDPSVAVATDTAPTVPEAEPAAPPPVEASAPAEDPAPPPAEETPQADPATPPADEGTAPADNAAPPADNSAPPADTTGGAASDALEPPASNPAPPGPPAAARAVTPQAAVTAPGWNDKIAICHSTESESNPYVFIRPSVRSIVSDDQGDPAKAHSVHHDFGDIIPSFDYYDQAMVLHHFGGLNLDLIGMLDVQAKDCGTVTPTIDVIIDRCTSPNGSIPAVGVAISNLVAGFEYTVTIGIDDVAVDSHTFVPVSTSFQWSLSVPGPGVYWVTLHRTNDESGAQDAEATANVMPCPRIDSVWTVQKDAATDDGTPTVVPGDTIFYTVTVKWLSGPAPQDITIVDDIAGVEPYASVGTITPADESQTIAYDPVAQTITWGNVDFAGEAPAQQTLYISYIVNPDVYGPVIVNSIDNSHCVVDNCVTENPTPAWIIQKSSWPESGSTVEPGDYITYYLDVRNVSEGDATVSGAMAVDNLSGVLAYSEIDELGPGLTLVGDQLTWAIPDLPTMDDTDYTWFTVIVNENVLGQIVHNVVAPTTPGGDCATWGEGPNPPDPAACVTDHPGVNVDLLLEKTAEGGPVSSGANDQIAYTVAVSNVGDDATFNPVVTDTLPADVTLSGAVAVVTTPPGNEAFWSIDTSVPGVITASYDGWFGPDDTATFTFTGVVGNLVHPAPAVLPTELTNNACVEGFRFDWGSPEVDIAPALVVEPEGDLLPDWDTNPANNCDSASTSVKKPVPVVPLTPVTPAALPSTGVVTGWMLPLAASTLLLGGLALALSSRRRKGVDGN